MEKTKRDQRMNIDLIFHTSLDLIIVTPCKIHASNVMFVHHSCIMGYQGCTQTRCIVLMKAERVTVAFQGGARLMCRVNKKKYSNENKMLHMAASLKTSAAFRWRRERKQMRRLGAQSESESSGKV